MSETLQGGRFQPWEVEMLLELERLAVSGANGRKRVLRRYQEAVHRHAEQSPSASIPLKLSEYLHSLEPNGEHSKPAVHEGADLDLEKRSRGA